MRACAELDTAAADWEEKFGALLNWKDRNGGDTRVPFNSPGEDGLGWWVATQRQALRKGKMSEERKTRLDSIGFCWNPTETPRRGRLLVGRTGPRHQRPTASLSTGAPEDGGRMQTGMRGLHVHSSAQSFETGAQANGIDYGAVQTDNTDVRKGVPLPAMRALRQTSNKRRFEEAGVGSSKRHHSFTGDASNYFGFGFGSEPGSYDSGSERVGRQPMYEPGIVQRASSFTPMSGPQWTVPQPSFGSGSTTPASESARTFSGTGAELASSGNYQVGNGDLQLRPLVFNSSAKPPSIDSTSGPNSGSGTFTFGQAPLGLAAPMLPPVSSIRPAAPEPDVLSWQQENTSSAARSRETHHPQPRDHHHLAAARGRRTLTLTDRTEYGQEAEHYGAQLRKDPHAPQDLSQDNAEYAAHGTSWQTAPSGEENVPREYARAAETLADLSRLDMSDKFRSDGYQRRGIGDEDGSAARGFAAPYCADSLPSVGLVPRRVRTPR